MDRRRQSEGANDEAETRRSNWKSNGRAERRPPLAIVNVVLSFSSC
jgi:hypothetical protein